MEFCRGRRRDLTENLNHVIFTSTAKQVRNRDFSEGELSLDTSIRKLTMPGIAGGCFSGSKIRDAFENAGAKRSNNSFPIRALLCMPKRDEVPGKRLQSGHGSFW